MLHTETTYEVLSNPVINCIADNILRILKRANMVCTTIEKEFD